MASVLADDLLYQIILHANLECTPASFFDFVTVSKVWYSVVEKICQKLCTKNPLQFWLNNIIPSKYGWMKKYYCIYYLPLEFREDPTRSLLFVRRWNQNSEQDKILLEHDKIFSDWMQSPSKPASTSTTSSFNPWRKVARYIGGVYFYEIHIISIPQLKRHCSLKIGFIALDTANEDSLVQINASGCVLARTPFRSGMIVRVQLDKNFKSPLFGEGDTVGVGVELNENKMFFTLNGELMEDGVVDSPVSKAESWSPCVRCREQRAVLSPNVVNLHVLS
eukprot:TRINITY_DN8108_c0_g1_i1.p1 TRINITY_DN8108_c0_g1~~TRINITY_DN8108_c0_g1_i1.p1  ORF type:complete len:278 (-),score=9.63 TRINITY_DN8108_c0_g1_i1:182-1015(-)